MAHHTAYHFISQTGSVYGIMLQTIWDPTLVAPARTELKRCWQEVVEPSMCRLSRKDLTDFTFGCGSMAIECIPRRRFVLLVCRHKKAMSKMLKDRLTNLARDYRLDLRDPDRVGSRFSCHGCPYPHRKLNEIDGCPSKWTFQKEQGLSSKHSLLRGFYS